MGTDRADIVLNGCSPAPVSSYLKALGIVKVLSRQADGSLTACWSEGDRFRIRTSLSPEEIAHFFLHDYSPSPLIDPWNGGSGGIGFTDWNPAAELWQPGGYEVQLFLGTEFILSDTFTVEGEPPPVTVTPSLTPSPFPQPTQTPTPSPT